MRRPSVLIADDDAFSRAVVSKKLAGHANVVEAADGAEAFARLQSTLFDLAIVDLEMPNFDGFELIKCIRGHPKLRHVPVIVLTGNEKRSALDHALSAGATSFLMKPLNWLSFGEHIRHVMELAYRANHLAMHDSLTGLPNRVLINEQLQHSLMRMSPDKMIAVHLLDLDEFKYVNDTMGHGSGDKLLQVVAERLRPLVRDTDTIARMGGDEFAILQASVTSPEDAEALARRINDALSLPIDIDGNFVSIGTSIGIAIGPQDGATAELLMRNADLALYQAKDDGRGAYRRYKADMNEQKQARRIIEYELRNALEKDQFELHFQPLVNLSTNEICGFEALARWRHPEKGLITPDAFIPIAEECGLITQIGAWTLRQACMVAAPWPSNLKVAVNVSPVQLRDANLMQHVVRAIAASGIAPGRLELELTETACLNDDASMLNILHQIRNMGVRIATDDFGIGYSSLSLLQKFPFDKIKIDRTFVQEMSKSASSLSIVRAVVALAKGLGIPSTAEGVENPEQLASVIAEGCTEMQGYLLSRPIPAKDVLKFLSSRQQGAASAA